MSVVRSTSTSRESDGTDRSTQTLRYRSRLGTSRATFSPDDDLSAVHSKIAQSIPSAQHDSIAVSDKPSGPFRLLSEFHGRTIAQAGMKHGDMLFLQFDDATSAPAPSAASNGSAAPITTSNKLSGTSVAVEPVTAVRSARRSDAWKTVKQHPLDDALEKLDGKIPRSRNRMCKHGAKGMCDYCMPLEPFDATYLEEHKIKFASFHAYLRKINSATNKPELNSSFIPPLEEPDVTVDPFCKTGHAPWPGGICSKCQPSAITLQRQEYRMVDHLEFASPSIVDTFLNAWRKSGSQRFGYMYGYYEAYDNVPLGQKAVVEAIYEPPQVDHADGLELLEFEDETRVDRIAMQCGLERVGIIFTDLTDDGTGKGTVLAKRHKDSFFLSSLEASMAASYQARYPNKSHWAASGRFGSKFVTAVITGSVEGQIDIAPYQISEQGVAMLEANIVEPSADPNTMLICKEGGKAYIPDVFYSKINEYGRQVKENAKPAFPMEYLLVELTHGFPNDPKPKFKRTTFPVENRASVGEAGDLQQVGRQLDVGKETSLSAVSDFHLVQYIASLEILSEEELDSLCKAAAQEDVDAGAKLVAGDGWATLLAILSESGA